MRAMILAAGRGKRMGQLTQNIPKPLVAINNKPLIAYNIERLVVAGVHDIVINIAYLGEQIQQAIGNGSQFGANIIYSPEPVDGFEVAGGIINALPLLGDKPFITLNADVWTDYDCRQLVKQTPDAAHLVLVDNPAHNPKGDFLWRDNRCVTQDGESLTFSGLAVFNPEFFASYELSYLKLRPLLDAAIAREQVTAEYYRGIWQDVGTPERLAQTANLSIK